MRLSCAKRREGTEAPPIRTVLLVLTFALLLVPPLAAAFETLSIVRAVAPGWTYEFHIGTFSKTASGQGCDLQKSSLHAFPTATAAISDSFQTSTQTPRHIKVATVQWAFEGDFVQNGPEWLAVNGTGLDSSNGLTFAAVPATQPICPVPTVLPVPVKSPVPLPNNPVIKS